MKMNEPVASNEAALQDAFPAVDPGAVPVGGRILVQWRQTIKKTTNSGIVLVEETKETEKWNNQVAKVIALGPLAFKKRDTLEPWPGGQLGAGRRLCSTSEVGWRPVGGTLWGPQRGRDRTLFSIQRP
jgi:hypothetical protein